jgi:hypothetical protein
MKRFFYARNANMQGPFKIVLHQFLILQRTVQTIDIACASILKIDFLVTLMILKNLVITRLFQELTKDIGHGHESTGGCRLCDQGMLR